MYSNEDRMRVIKLYLEYECNSRAVIRELGYPSRNRLAEWYKEYLKHGNLDGLSKNNSKYSKEQREKAIDYYLKHGKSINGTIKVLGYPGKSTLCEWLNEEVPHNKRKWSCKASKSLVRCTSEQKEQAVKDYCTGTHTPTELSKIYGVDPNTIYRWKDKLLVKENKTTMSNKAISTKNDNVENGKVTVNNLIEDKASLEKQVKDLEKDIKRLKLEKDILQEAAKVIKKDQGINLASLNNREKVIVINALRDRYNLKYLLEILNMAKSSYCYLINSMKHDKYEEMHSLIKIVFTEARGCYGYRRIHSVIKTSGIIVSEKVVRRIMKIEQLKVTTVQTKKYNSYKGEISPEVANVIERNFHADKPNTKWLTDITEFRIPAGKIYLSPIIDCFDGLPISWTIGTAPDANLVNTMLDEAISILRSDEKPIIHSDRGSHYRWPGWIERMENNDLIRSMSRKGCSPDNSACEGFFGRLKIEMFYGYSWSGVSINQFIEELDKYIKWYAEKRIKISLGGMSPLDYRKSLGLVV